MTEKLLCLMRCSQTLFSDICLLCIVVITIHSANTLLCCWSHFMTVISDVTLTLHALKVQCCVSCEARLCLESCSSHCLVDAFQQIRQSTCDPSIQCFLLLAVPTIFTIQKSSESDAVQGHSLMLAHGPDQHSSHQQ